MIPYFPPPVLTIAGVSFHAFGALVACAILTGVAVFLRRMSRSNEPAPLASRYILCTVGAGLILSHLLSVLLLTPDQSSNISQLANIPQSIWSFAGLAGAIAAALIFLQTHRITGLRRWQYLDSTTLAFVTGWIFGRAGCALVHDHPGIPSTSIFAVQFPTGPRLDLGLVEMLFTLCAALILHTVDRHPRRPGFFLGSFLLAYGLFRFWLSFLRGQSIPQDIYFAAIATVAGAWILLRHRQFQILPTPLDERTSIHSN
jgi:phosphatidylglycerol:prolipoprotein diacylglycerol transferase